MPAVTFTLNTLPTGGATKILRFEPRDAPWINPDGEVVTPDGFQRSYSRGIAQGEMLDQGAWRVRIGTQWYPFDVPAGGGDLATLIAWDIPAGTPASTLAAAVESFGAAWLASFTDTTLAEKVSATGTVRTAVDDRIRTVGDANYAPVWQPNTAYATDDKVTNPLGIIMARIAAGTSRASWDSTEQDAWSIVYAPVGSLTKPSGDTRVGILDWAQDSATGYLMHLTVGPNSGSSNAALAIGTDRGAASGILISHKNSGRGIDLGVQPGAGSGIQITGRSGAGFPTRFMLKPGSLPVSLRADSGAGFADGVTTSGSNVLTSATAAFTAGDVGKAISQLTSRGPSDPMGTIPAATTITSVTSATEVVMSANATATVTGLLFQVADRVVPDSQSLLSVQDEVSATYTTISKRGVAIKGTDIAFPPLRVTRKSGQTAPIADFRDESGNLLSAIGPGGHLLTKAKTALSGADLSNSTVGFYIDDTAGAQRLLITGKDASGTTATTAIPIGVDKTKRRAALAVGKYYGIYGVATQPANPTLNRMRVHEFHLDETATFDRIGTEVTTTVESATLRWVIYADAGGYPGDLILDTGAVGDAETATGWQETTIDQTLTAGRYWMACIVQGGEALVRCTSGSIATPGAGLADGAEIVTQVGANTGFRTDGVTGAAPSNFPASKPGSAFAPMVWVRKSA